MISPDPVPRDLIERAIEAAHGAPSAAKRQPWHFVAVANPDVKPKNSEAAEKVNTRLQQLFVRRQQTRMLATGQAQRLKSEAQQVEDWLAANDRYRLWAAELAGWRMAFTQQQRDDNNQDDCRHHHQHQWLD